MRKITDHKLTGLNDAIEITALGLPLPDGANHRYNVTLAITPNAEKELIEIEFQNGPIGEVGYNGISNEALLAVVIDRMRGFQGHNMSHYPTPSESIKPPFSCRENAVALTKLEEALMWLQKRTRDRLARGVEGTHKV